MWLPVRTGTYWVHTVLLLLVLHFSYFWRVHAEYILILGQYVLLVRDSIVCMPGPAGLFASYSGTRPCIDPNHTKALAGLFTAVWQHPCQCLGTWALALAGCWGIQLLWVSFTWLTAAMVDSAVCSPAEPAPASNTVHAADWRVKESGFKLGCQLWAAKYSSNPAKFKFRAFLREIKQRAHLAWSWAVQLETKMSTLSSD